MSVSLHNSQYQAHTESRTSLHGVSWAKAGDLTVGLTPEFVKRFSLFIQYTPTCWLWTAALDAYGYGKISRPGRSPIKAHRVAWMLIHGPIASDRHVLHRCDTPRCVNPDHLFLGNQSLNMKDAAAKGRLHGPRPNGRTLSSAAEQDILAIYRTQGRKATRGLRDQLATKYSVSPAYISMIGRGLRQRQPVEVR